MFYQGFQISEDGRNGQRDQQTCSASDTVAVASWLLRTPATSPMATVDVEGAPFCGTRLVTSDIGGCKFGDAEPRFDTDHGEQYSAVRETLVLAPIAKLRSF